MNKGAAFGVGESRQFAGARGRATRVGRKELSMRRTLAICAGFLAVAGTGRVLAVCSIAGPNTITCDGTTYRAVDDECVHYVDLAAYNAAHPGVPLPDLKKTIADNYDADAVPAPTVVELTDYVDCTQTSHNFTEANLCSSSPHPNKPSRLMNISGKTFRVTAAPDDGFATYYYSYDLATGGTAGVPHLLVAESSNDQERYTSLTIHYPDGIIINPGQPWAPPYAGEPTINPWGDPWWSVNPPRTQEGTVFGPDVGLTVYTGRELPIDNQPFNVSLIFHAKTATARVVVSSLGCNLTRTGTDGGAVSRMWVFKFADAMASRYPVITPPTDPSQQRRIGIYVTHPWYLYAHHGTPVRLLSQRQADLQRVVQHLKYSGFNYLVFNAINGSDRSSKAWYSGSAYFPWNSAGDLLSELPPIAQTEGIQLVPLITSLTVPTYSGGLSFSNTSYQLGTDNDYTRAFGTPTLDPLRPEVQQLTKNLLTEIATRCASNPAVRGIGIRANGKIGTCYTSDDSGSRGAKLSGYSSWDLQQFASATGSGVPTGSGPGTAYSWLTAQPAEWESWINWRCQKTRDFWLACRDLIKTYRSDLIFYVQCDLPSETPGTNIEWAGGQTPYDLLRQHGYDPNMFVNDTGIVISRGMMVAEDRFYVSTRWGAPWGSNYQNYRLFHFAPGLAELYRTAAGRACEMYQNYWEETFNPYWEFGSCGDPNGFFRTNTPAAPGRAFFQGATMGLRRQDPDTITWLGWNRPTLGHEADLRKFAQAFRALPAVSPTSFNGTIDPSMNEVVARWYDDRLAVINDTNAARTLTLNLAQPVPAGYELADVVNGRKLITASQSERQHLSFSAEAYSLTTFLYAQAGPAADFTTDALPSEPPLAVQFHDASTATNITTWNWDFGDTGTGSGPDPQHTYAAFGTYSVTLTITADGGPYTCVKPVSLVAVPPVVADESPPRGASIGSLSFVSVTFSKTVTGVDAGDLTVNGSAATTVSGSGAGPYVFGGFASPSVGAVNVELGPGGIQGLSGSLFAGDSWSYTIPSPPVPGVGNPSFEDAGGSYNGWEIVYVSGEGPDNPPLDNTNIWGPRTTFGTHFGGKITNGLGINFYLGQVVGTSNWRQASTAADWQFSAYVQLNSTQSNNPNPTGLHQVWEIGWMNDGSEPANVSSCDHYQMIADIDGNYTGNDKVNFYPLTASGTVTGVTGLRGLAIRAHLYNDDAWWWTLDNIDNLSFTVTSVAPESIPGDMDADGDVDSADYALFEACIGGPGVGPPASGCDKADIEGDGDVDQGDFGLLQRCLSGPDVQVDPTCVN
jgi:PKD repeat protein